MRPRRPSINQTFVLEEPDETHVSEMQTLSSEHTESISKPAGPRVSLWRAQCSPPAGRGVRHLQYSACCRWQWRVSHAACWRRAAACCSRPRPRSIPWDFSVQGERDWVSDGAQLRRTNDALSKQGIHWARNVLWLSETRPSCRKTLLRGEPEGWVFPTLPPRVLVNRSWFLGPQRDLFNCHLQSVAPTISLLNKDSQWAAPENTGESFSCVPVTQQATSLSDATYHVPTPQGWDRDKGLWFFIKESPLFRSVSGLLHTPVPTWNSVFI